MPRQNEKKNVNGNGSNGTYMVMVKKSDYTYEVMPKYVMNPGNPMNGNPAYDIDTEFFAT